jgi:hypothetical protein
MKEVIKKIRDKMRARKNWERATDKALAKLIFDVMTLKRDLEELIKELTKPEPEPETEQPKAVNDLESLTAYVKAWFPDDINRELQASEVKPLARKIQEHLIEDYPEAFSRHPSWTKKGHDDAIYYIPEDKIIDFVRDSTSGGRLIDKLQWHTVG